MDLIIIFLSIGGGLATVAAGGLKWYNDHAIATAKSLEQERQREADDRKAEIRQGEIAELIMAKKQLEFAQTTALRSQTKLLSDGLPPTEASSISGLDKAIDVALREVPAAAAAAIRQQAADAAWQSDARTKAHSLDVIVRPKAERLLRVLRETVRSSHAKGMVDLQTDTMLAELPGAIVYPPDARHLATDDGLALPVHTFELGHKIKWTVTFHLGFVETGPTGTRHPYKEPEFVINDSRIGPVLRIGFQDISSPDPTSLTVMRPNAIRESMPQAMIPRLTKLQEEYSGRKLSDDELIYLAVLEALKQSIISARMGD